MRNDLMVAIASTHAEGRQNGADIPMTDATGELSAPQSQVLDEEFLEKERREQSVREHAYEIWENAGRPHGMDVDHWLLAEQQVGGKDPEA